MRNKFYQNINNTRNKKNVEKWRQIKKFSWSNK